MNLEDFKSFRRVLKPSGVGSIPTHSRQFLRGRFLRNMARRAALGAVGLALLAPAARADDAVPVGTPRPFARAVRSAVFPAWGQLTNGKSKKAVVLFTAQTYLITRVLGESRAAHEADRRAATFAGREDPAGLALGKAARANAQEHFDTRRDLLFWSLMGAFYGALDAYVDAHLGRFDEELDEGRTLFGGVDPAGRAVEVGLRF